MRPYLEGYHFHVMTDHHSLKWLHSLENPSGRLARWALELQQYDFEIHYRKGALNVVADTLSRDPLPITEEDKLAAARDTVTIDWYQKKRQQVEKEPDNYPEYRLDNDRLFRRFTNLRPLASPNEHDWKLCVPPSDRDKVLYDNHDAVTAGHLGVAKTISRMAQRYFWPGMFRDISKYVRKCQSCNRYKPSQEKPTGFMYTTQADQPWEIVCADFIGPLPKSMKGHTYLLVMTDKFTKWVEATPLRAATTTTLVKAIREQIINRFGVPRMFLSDNGTQFTSHQFKEFLADLGIEHRLTAPYTPQENPTERVNRVLKTMMAQYVHENQRHWDEHVPELTFAINTSRHESTGYSPAVLNFGRELRGPNEFGTETRNNPPTETQSMRQERMNALYEIVKRNMRSASQVQAKAYNLRRRLWKPAIGEQVYRKIRHLSSGADYFAGKLAPRYDGPFEVVRYQSPVITILRRKEGTKKKENITCYIRDLKGYSNDEDEVSQAKTAAINLKNKIKLSFIRRTREQ